MKRFSYRLNISMLCVAALVQFVPGSEPLPTELLPSEPLPNAAPKILASQDDSDGTEWEKLEKHLHTLLAEQQTAWNRGDIRGFMRTYWESEELTFCSGGDVTKGWQSTLERYLRRYPNATAMGQLSFTSLESVPLGDAFVRTIGKWELERTEPISGRFTLIWRKTEQDGWKIMHDHTSVSE